MPWLSHSSFWAMFEDIPKIIDISVMGFSMGIFHGIFQKSSTFS
jgi:hypothetical protein